MAKVLLIRTDHLARLLFRNVLECAGHAVMTAGEFAEGRKYLSQYGADVVLAELQGPESEAIQAIAHLRTEFPLVKILVLARREEPVDFLAVRLMGADDVLRHPLATDALLDAVDQALRGEDVA